MANSLLHRNDLHEMTGGHRANGHLVSSPSDLDFVLRSVLRVLGLGPKQLCRLIGRNLSNSHHWFSLGGSPSQAYWVRISYLLLLVQQGGEIV